MSRPADMGIHRLRPACLPVRMGQRVPRRVAGREAGKGRTATPLGIAAGPFECKAEPLELTVE